MDRTVLEIIGWAGSAILVVSLLQTNLHRLRWINLVGCVILVGYNAVLGVWPMVGLNVVLAGVNAWHLVRGMRERHDDRAYEILQVDGDDSYLRHVLRVHEADIRRFTPDFVHDPFAKDDAYLVLTGDETVGVTIVRAEPDGIGQVLLDYVTPRYRDRSPGEFVFGPAGPIRANGYRRVKTPSGMVAPYYDRLGFTRVGDHFELTVG